MVSEVFEGEPTVLVPDGFSETSSVVDSISAADRLLVVDVSNLAFRSSYAYDLKTSTDIFAGHVYGSVYLLSATLKNYLPAGKWCVIFCYDGPGAKALRQKILPGYKDNRDKDRYNPIPDVEAVLRNIPGIHVKAPEREGDDAIAWAVEKFGHKPIVILSGDRDLWALLSSGVRVWSPNKKRFVEDRDILKDYLVEDPGSIPLSKALFGDSSDGISGVDRLLKDYAGTHLRNSKGSVEELMRSVMTEPVHIPEGKKYSAKKDQSTRDKILSDKQVIIDNLAVITPYTSGFNRADVVKTPATPDVKSALEQQLQHYECRTLINRIDEWFGSEFYIEEPDESEK